MIILGAPESYCYLYQGCNTVRFPRYNNHLQKLSRCHSKQYYTIGIIIMIIIIRYSDFQKKLSKKFCTASYKGRVQGSGTVLVAHVPKNLWGAIHNF